MSFILDALKKSELERQRQVVPGLMDTRAARPRSRLPLWAIGLMLLLGFNLTVLTVVLTRGGLNASRSPAAQSAPSMSAAQPAPPASPAPSARLARADALPPGSPAAAAPAATVPGATVPTATAPPDHFSPLDGAQGSAPVYAPEIPVTSDAGGEAADGIRTAAAKSHAPESAARDLRRKDPPPTARDEKPDDEVLPTFGEINPGGQDALPALHLDVHVYATDPADRFVYINMHKYREGSTLAEGPTVERIRRDGVVLDYHGLRFVLPRQQ